ncbi:PpiC-type peptidyl-prolyl cis-trans isomerase [Ancylobacter novellus DSM 506]|uniref:Parvulin-like PPIase n=1 Tax=Ancylobacter novellus (strain ATCC 8093 / DSM 506 / JCM 20403 / CCM 1077 / IAM 12100 / NBRC 12443 / NCIMB 10456) TaxID=639283 RepID=D6ZYK5_ANCN5|nr:peptidylprolyl isomerase [Ancylobacter novellus]ADH89117.1 PpiC-type peptidyl-prolyl cis-trans isomerase [Ancylobacter novellus DSM 506]
MLETLRKSASGIVAKILMGLLIVSFGIWGIADVFRGFGSQTLATIGDTEITVPEFRQLYQQRLQQVSQQLKRGITPEQARAFGIPDQLLQEQLAEAALNDQAKSLGLALSDAEIARRVQSNPSFFGPGGSFDPNYFNQLLRSNGFTEARFVEAERGLAVRQQLIQSLGGGVTVPQVLKDALARYESEERSVNYAMLTAHALPALAEPSDEELRKFFDERKIAFRAPEYRKVSVLVLTPEALANSESISDADVEAAYKANLASYGTPEKRVVQQIVFPNEQEAAAAAARITAGTPFADIIAERKLEAKDVELGDVTRADIFDKAVADAAFALAPDATSGVVAGRFGPVIVHVGTVTPGTTKPLTEVAGQIRTQLQLDTARRAVLTKYDQIEDERAGGAMLAEIASKAGIPVQSFDTNIQGQTPDGSSIPSIPGRAEVLRGAFAADVGSDNDPVQLPQNGGYVWFAVDGITAPRDRTFEEARAQVLDRWKQDQTAQALDKKVEDIKAKVAGGEAFDKAVTDAGLELRAANGLRRGRAADGVPQDILEAVFETPQGQVGSSLAEGGESRLLFQVLRVSVPPAATQDEKLLSDVRQSLENDLMTEYVVELQGQLGPRINRAALDQIVGTDAVN